MEQTCNRIYGEYLGYPSCCIKAFGDRAIPFVFRPKIVQEMTLNGFLPCEKHAMELRLGRITYDELINPHRKCSIPFKTENNTVEEYKIIGDELFGIIE